MRPPEAALFRARNVFRQIGDRVMQPMISDPARGVSRTVEDGPEDQELLDNRVGLERLMRQHAVITNRRAEPAKCGEEHRQTKNLEARHGKKDQADDGKNVNEDQVSENAFLAVNRFPKWPFPRVYLWRLLRQANFHVFSDDLQRSAKIEGAGNPGPFSKKTTTRITLSALQCLETVKKVVEMVNGRLTGNL